MWATGRKIQPRGNYTEITQTDNFTNSWKFSHWNSDLYSFNLQLYINLKIFFSLCRLCWNIHKNWSTKSIKSRADLFNEWKKCREIWIFNSQKVSWYWFLIEDVFKTRKSIKSFTTFCVASVKTLSNYSRNKLFHYRNTISEEGMEATINRESKEHFGLLQFFL